MTQPSAIVRPVIMCGGSGTRLWPASREAFPKQFAPIIGERSTFQETLLRVQDPTIFGKPVVITNQAHRFLVERQMNEVGVPCDILLEPIARDSGPAIIASSLFVAEATPGALVLILAADHMVLDPAGFRQAVADGRAAAQNGAIVTFGIVPTSPATGYGYIAPGAPLEGKANKVARFVEKPNFETAVSYISKGYLWNSGNFLFRPDVVIGEYAAGDAASVDAIRTALRSASSDLGVPVLDETAFLAAKKISFDYAVMEKATNAAVIAGDFGWSDIGGWDALWAISRRDENDNAAHGDVAFFDTHASYASSENQHVALLGVRDIVVVATHDAVLVADKARSGEVKGVVEALKTRGRGEATTHARVHRPWGWHQELERAPGFIVNRIVIYPGGRLSVQKHARRSEHWVVVTGEARVTNGGSVSTLGPSQSTYIPAGTVHRLENAGSANVEIVEVQCGDHLEQDDIIRLEP